MAWKYTEVLSRAPQLLIEDRIKEGWEFISSTINLEGTGYLVYFKKWLETDIDHVLSNRYTCSWSGGPTTFPIMRRDSKGKWVDRDEVINLLKQLGHIK